MNASVRESVIRVMVRLPDVVAGSCTSAAARGDATRSDGTRSGAAGPDDRTAAAGSEAGTVPRPVRAGRIDPMTFSLGLRLGAMLSSNRRFPSSEERHACTMPSTPMPRTWRTPSRHGDGPPTSATCKAGSGVTGGRRSARTKPSSTPCTEKVRRRPCFDAPMPT